MKKWLELFALVWSFIAVCLLDYSLITNIEYCLILLEPIRWIRYAEIIWGSIAIPFLCWFIIKKMKEII